MPVLTPFQLTLCCLFALFVIVTLVLFLRLFRAIRQCRRDLEDTTLSLVNMKEALGQLQHQQQEDQTRTVVVTRHFKKIEEQIDQFEQQIRDLKLQDPSMRLYQRAAELVKQGASMEEVMEACDIPRAEAELLMTVHRNKS